MFKIKTQKNCSQFSKKEMFSHDKSQQSSQGLFQMNILEFG